MKFNKTILLVILPLFLLVGCDKPKNKQEQKPKQEEKKSFSLKNALTLGKSLKCSYKNEKGETVVWIKGKKMRMEGAGFGKGKKGGMVNDGEWIYIWTSAEKKGMKYKLSDLNSLGEQAKDVADWKNVKEWAEKTEQKYHTECHTAIIGDNKFTPPSDIEFKDFSAIFSQVQEMKKAMPSVNSGESINSEKIKEMMNKFKPEQ